MKYLKLFEDFDDHYSVDELISMHPKQLGELLFKDEVLKQPKVVKNILSIGANLDVVDSVHMMTPLHWASYEGYVETVKLLIDAGASLDALDNTGLTPLHSAAATGHADSCSVLLKAGASLDALDYSGHTPLHWAAWNRHVDACRALIEAGASLDVLSSHGRTPWDLAHNRVRKALPELNPNR